MHTPEERARLARSYYPHLDALRAAAVMAVVLRHALPVEGRAAQLLSWGSLGVTLFFVLSGYLITRMLMEERRDAAPEHRGYLLRRFWLRRALRIFPLYYLVLGLDWLLGDPLLRESLGWHLAYLTNVWIAQRNEWAGGLSPLWSLSVEEQFYLLWPVLLVFLPIRRLPHVLLAAVAIGVGFRWVLTLAGQPIATVLLPGSIDQLAIGGLLAYSHVHRGGAPAWLGRAGGLAALALVGMIVFSVFTPGDPTYYPWVFGPALFAMTSALWIDRGTRGFQGFAGRIASSSLIIFVGKISYGIYLTHELLVPRMLYVAGFTHGSRFEFFASVLLTTFVFCSLSWFLFEKPILRLKSLIPLPAEGRARTRGAL